jgi:hypothetical protein
MTRTHSLTTIMVASQKHQHGGPSLAVDPFSISIPSHDSTLSSHDEAAYQELRGYVKKLRPTTSDASHVDAAFKEYTRLKNRTKSLCETLLRPRSHRPLSLLSPVSTIDSARTPSFETSSLGTFETRTSRSSRSSAGYGTLSSYIFEQHLDVIRDWVDCLEDLRATFRESLANTYRQWEPEASPAMVDQLFRDKKFRSNAIQRMRNASISKTVSANLDFFPKYDIRFRDYEKFASDVNELRFLLQAGESGISPERTIEEIIISQHGDAILEFANKASEDYPVFRFKVSSHMLAETSPIFALMFNHSLSTGIVDIEAASSLPSTPSRYTCKDGSEAMLFRMPQTELNVGKSFEILLHAAHMHNDVVPRDVGFDQFISIAEACMRYQCTSPLELSVEYRWLPQWMHKANDDMPDGLLLISYAFGLRRLFTRMTKTAILNIADEKDLQAKSWPQKIKDKVWAVRTAKIDQVYTCCHNAIQEYLRCPSATIPKPDPSNVLNTPGLVPTSSPRCPKGSHSCDATSLGWLMMVFNELHILPHIMRPSTPYHYAPAPKRSLNQIVDSLRFMASPPQAHRGVCDFAPSFRTAMNDIYNSVSGLTLFEISGKHGWALSKHKSVLPQAVFKIGAPLPDLEAVKRAREKVALTIMGHLDSIEDVYNAALINKTFFETFKNNELAIIKGLLKKSKNSVPQRWTVEGATSKREARHEMKALRAEKARLKESQLAKISADIVDGSDAPVGIAADSDSVAELQSAFDEDSEGMDDGGEDTESESLIEVDDSSLTSPPRLSEAQVQMTREEAERILWPDSSHQAEMSPQRLRQPSPQPQGNEIAPVEWIREQSEKFRAGDVVFTTVEEKILVTGDNKYLTEEHDRELGLGRQKNEDGRDDMDVWI